MNLKHLSLSDLNTLIQLLERKRDNNVNISYDSLGGEYVYELPEYEDIISYIAEVNDELNIRINKIINPTK